MRARRSSRRRGLVLIGAVAALAVATAVTIVVATNKHTTSSGPQGSGAPPGTSAPPGSTTPGSPAAPLAVNGWLIPSSDVTHLLKVNHSLTTLMLDNPRTVLLGNNHAPVSLPAGWSTSVADHFTSLAPCPAACTVFEPSQSQTVKAQIQAKSRGTAPVALFDEEDWNRTASSEVRAPCPAMASFVSAAKRAGLQTIVAPDQNLGAPGAITSYEGGETENWQTYLRLGIAACAAAAHPDRFHIMSQAFESHWCDNKAGGCQGGESDFVNFVTQAALQARAVDPSVQLSDGLGANPRYGATAGQMYQDSVDVHSLVNTIWMNLVGPSAPKTTLNLFGEIAAGASATVRSSVLFAGSRSSFGLTVPSASRPSSLNLSQPGATATFASPQAVPGGTVIPAGAYELQYWTGPGSGTATVSLALGYCRDAGCTQRVPLVGNGTWNATLAPNGHGAATSGGALTTPSSVALPSGGPYRLYWSATVGAPGAFPLLFGSASDPTNLATPLLFKVSSGQVAKATGSASPTVGNQVPPSSSQVPPTTVHRRHHPRHRLR